METLVVPAIGLQKESLMSNIYDLNTLIKKQP